MKNQYEVEGMTCTACAVAIERQLAKVEGVTRVNVNFASEKMLVEYNEEYVNEGLLSDEVKDIGYKLIIDKPPGRRSSNSLEKSKVEEHKDYMKFRLLFSLVFTIPLFYIAMGPMIGMYVPSFFTNHNNALIVGLIQLLLTIPVMLINSDYYRVGFKTLYKKSPNMDSLIAVGTTAAFVYGLFVIFQLAYGYSYQNLEVVMAYRHNLYFESVVVILTLITVGKYLEARAKGKTLKAMEALMELAPETGMVLINDVTKEVPVEELKHGDILVIKAGNKIPLDGEIIEGTILVDESMLTGESLPLEKIMTEILYAGTYAQTGYAQIKVTKTREETALFNIVKLVEEAQSTKAPIAKLADRISAYFVPVVLGLSLVTFIVWILLGEGISFAFQMAVSVLVISCPCALGLATPTAIMVGTGKGASYGTLIKSGEALEQLHQIDTLVFDKTGTLTIGKPVVAKIEVNHDVLSNSEFVSFVTSVESLSEHPYAKAIGTYGELEKTEIKEVTDYETLPGKGVVGVIDHHKVIVGNERLMLEYNIDINLYRQQLDAEANKGRTPLLIGIEQQIAGYIIVEDVIKDDAMALVGQLKQLGIDVVMLTGDHEKTAKAIGYKLGISKVYAGVLPDGKAKVIEELMTGNKVVAMVGDGINDAVALTKANVGIAIGTGTDVAIESADVVLVKDSLQDVMTAIELSKATIRNIKQNLFWAFFYNIIGIPLAAGVLYYGLGFKLNPMFAAGAMSLSSVSVVTNALRLRGFKPSKLSLTTSQVTNDEVIVTQINKIENSSIINEERGIKMKKLAIEGMTCMHCVGRVDKALKEVEGVSEVKVDLENNSAAVACNDGITNEMLIGVVVEAGYEVTHISEVS